MAKVVGLSIKDAKRLRTNNNQFERGRRNTPPTRGRQNPPYFASVLPAKTGGSLVAGGTISSPTSFTCTIMIPSGTGFTTTGGTSVTAYNAYTGSIAASKLIWLVPFNNLLYVLSADCP